ncbi:unnamed protein product [Effrenium voratum]|uniref:U-box domain-containing protein n=1 Tax=Effrenium voratum TaxID=2562239 RepID=A0AA36J1D8_9DINO|nr:unnamed protein product [Effrenium voratum]CAJ1429794.1 unnamed protein product [Effrenium voratum]
MAPELTQLDDIFRQVARKFPEVTDWLCPIRGLLMEDPVKAEDGFNYERAAIQTWLEASDVSPQTRERMGKLLEENICLKGVIQQFKAFLKDGVREVTLAWTHGGLTDNTKRKVTLAPSDVESISRKEMCQELSKFFKELDPVEDLLHSTLDGLKVPKIVVVGDESAGKSTILEMLAMLPVFPRNARCCTRMAIHLRLRRTPGVSRATLTVSSAKGETKDVSMDMPQENGWLLVEEQMKRLQQELSEGSKIISDKKIIVEVHRPDVPCLDLVDLPGMVQSPPDKARQIEAIYEQQLNDDKSNGNQCIYLAVVAASGQAQPHTKKSVEFIVKHGLQGRTCGIFSKCDENNDADALRALTLGECTEDGESAESLGGIQLANGWVATMLKAPNGEHFKHHNFERIYLQQKQEADWFENPMVPDRKKHFASLLAGRAAGVFALVARVDAGYLKHLQENWKEFAVRRIFEKEAEAEFRLQLLGVVEDVDERQRLAQQEVQRRLGPDSEMTTMRNAFVKEVINETTEEQVRQVLKDFASGYSCEAHNFREVLKNKKDELMSILENVLKEMQACMVDKVQDILLASSKLCKDGVSDFNICTGSLRLYKQGACKSQWDVQEKLKEERIIQLCCYRDYVQAIVREHEKVCSQTMRNLREAGQEYINLLVDRRSPYLQVKSSFRHGKRKDSSDSRVVIQTDGHRDFVDDFLVCCLEHVPHPEQQQDLYKCIEVGAETPEARADFERLQEVRGLVKTARESVIRALAIGEDELQQMRWKFEVDQYAKEDAKEDLQMADVHHMEAESERATPASSQPRSAAPVAGPDLQEKCEEAADEVASARSVTSSGDTWGDTWEPVTSHSASTSEARPPSPSSVQEEKKPVEAKKEEPKKDEEKKPVETKKEEPKKEEAMISHKEKKPVEAKKEEPKKEEAMKGDKEFGYAKYWADGRAKEGGGREGRAKEGGGGERRE